MNHPESEMICSADEAQFMRLLLQLIKAKKVIEIGKIKLVKIQWSLFILSQNILNFFRAKTFNLSTCPK